MENNKHNVYMYFADVAALRYVIQVVRRILITSVDK